MAECPGMRLGAYRFRAAPRLADPEAAARGVIASLPKWQPGQGEAELRASLGPGGRLIRWRRYRAAFVVDESPVGPAHVKVYTPRDAVELAIETATPSRALTSWRMGLALLAAGIPTPEPLLWLSRKPWRLHRESVLVTQRLVDPVIVMQKELEARVQEGKALRPLLDEAARLAADLHRAGFFHGDFTSRNLLVSGGALSLIDLDRTKRIAWLPGPIRRRIQLLDLRMLLLTTWKYVPRRAWLRMLVVYFRRLGLPASKRAWYARAVLSAKRGRVRLGASNPALAPNPWQP